MKPQPVVCVAPSLAGDSERCDAEERDMIQNGYLALKSVIKRHFPPYLTNAQRLGNLGNLSSARPVREPHPNQKTTNLPPSQYDEICASKGRARQSYLTGKTKLRRT